MIFATISALRSTYRASCRRHLVIFVLHFITYRPPKSVQIPKGYGRIVQRVKTRKKYFPGISHRCFQSERCTAMQYCSCHVLVALLRQQGIRCVYNASSVPGQCYRSCTKHRFCGLLRHIGRHAVWHAGVSPFVIKLCEQAPAFEH